MYFYGFLGLCISRLSALHLAPSYGPGPRPLALAPNLYLLALAPNLYIPALAPILYLLALA